MTRGRLLLVAGTGLTLLLSAWVAAAGPVAIFRRQNANAVSPGRPRGSDFAEWSNVPPPPDKIYTSTDANEAVVAVIVWGLKLAIVGTSCSQSQSQAGSCADEKSISGPPLMTSS